VTPETDPAAPESAGAAPAHGVAGWPFGTPEPTPALPDRLPDGRPWGPVEVLIVAGDDRAATLASVERQDHPNVRARCLHDASEIPEAVSASAADHLLVLSGGDMLAPGALAALALEAALTGAAAVAGLRILYGSEVLALDAPSLAAPFPGDGILFTRIALAPHAHRPPAEWWSALGTPGAARMRIGRPVLLHGMREAPAPLASIRVASLTGTGYRGGAGIAHRRLTEALTLSGHRVTHLRLADESPPAAAEWTERFPKAEATLRQGPFDWVLSGNLHETTRSLGVLGRIGRHTRTAAVLHDLFPLTGRCAHPKGCERVLAGCDAACPTPDEFPQLAPSRIAAAHAEKRAVLADPRGPLLLANSAWTERTARRLAPPAARIAPVTLTAPAHVFRPMDRMALRARLGLPASDVLVMFSAVIADAPDKGFSDLAAALRAVARPGVGFVAIGRLDDPGRLGLPNLHAPGLISDEATLAAWYGACDLHVTASRHETLGQTPIEAGLCGTPTLAYRLTGLTTSVIDGVSGILVEPEPGRLASALADLVRDHGRRERLGALARIALENRFSHGAAALSLHDVLVAQGLLNDAPPRFLPGLLARYPMAAAPAAPRRGLVAAPSRPLVARLRRAKQAVFGRRMPLWARRALFLTARLRAALRSRPS